MNNAISSDSSVAELRNEGGIEPVMMTGCSLGEIPLSREELISAVSQLAQEIMMERGEVSMPNA